MTRLWRAAGRAFASGAAGVVSAGVVWAGVVSAGVVLAGVVLVGPAPAAAQSELCDDPAGYCSALVAPACLQRLGAGVVAAPDASGPAAPAGACYAQMESYRGCLSDVAVQCGGPAHDDGLGDLSPEVLAILEDPGAGLTGGAPLLSVMLAARCTSPQMMNFSCEGAPALIRFLLTSLSPNAELFRGMRFTVLSVEGGAARVVADLSDQILPAAAGGLSVAARMDALPRVFASCMLFTRDGARRGVVQIFGLQSGPGPRTAGMEGFQAIDLSGAQIFDPPREDCAAAASRIARERGA